MGNLAIKIILKMDLNSHALLSRVNILNKMTSAIGFLLNKRRQWCMALALFYINNDEEPWTLRIYW